MAHIGKSITIKGELSGSEDVYLDGELEGRVELLDGSLTVGPDGRIRANLQAPQILIRGQVDGNLYGRERVELKKSAVFVGDIYTPRIAIEDGAYVKGNVRSQEDIASPQTKKEGDTAAAKNSDLVSSARREGEGEPPVSKWRARALELFPNMRADVEEAESVGMLWCKLSDYFDSHYGFSKSGSQPELIRAIYLYVIWCTRAKSDDTFNAATIGFYEHVTWQAFRSAPSTYEQIVEDLVSNIGLPEIKRNAWAFRHLIAPHQFEKFLADCEQAERDLRRKSRKR